MDNADGSRPTSSPLPQDKVAALQAHLQKLQQQKLQVERELTGMQDTRDRLAGELGKQTGVAVRLSRPQQGWDAQPARRRSAAVGLYTACPRCAML